MKIYLIIIILLLIGALFIISENNLSLLNKESRSIFIKLYLGWIGKVFDNSKNIMGNVVKLDWFSRNNSN